MEYGLLGRTLGHSYSPAIHRELGGYDYELLSLEPAEVGPFLAGGAFRGLNVTIPYKKTVIPYCDALSPTARAIGSVNTLLRRPDGTLYGDNTDAAGFAAMVEKSGLSPAGKKALVLGSGGASLTVCHVLAQMGAGEVVVISRGGPDNYENLSRHTDAALLVNTTPVGMYPHTDAAPVDLTCLPRLEGVLDLIYNPARTRLLLQAAELGIPHAGGLPMLVGQAAQAAALFTGVAIPAQRQEDTLRRIARQTENLILIGMPGSGKSTVGRLLAEALHRPFVDSDGVIEEEAGLSIPAIFAREGEACFRARETAVLARLGREGGQVIATGGGCVTRPENRPLLWQNGVLFFLRRDLSRLDRAGRPLSQGRDLEAMFRARLPHYEAFAHHSVDNDGGPGETAQQILEVWQCDCSF